MPKKEQGWFHGVSHSDFWFALSWARIWKKIVKSWSWILKESLSVLASLEFYHSIALLYSEIILCCKRGFPLICCSFFKRVWSKADPSCQKTMGAFIFTLESLCQWADLQKESSTEWTMLAYPGRYGNLICTGIFSSQWSISRLPKHIWAISVLTSLKYTI